MYGLNGFEWMTDRLRQSYNMEIICHTWDISLHIVIVDIPKYESEQFHSFRESFQHLFGSVGRSISK